MAKIGDTVRYLNSVGGGKIVRIEGNIAYVDEDGFETPVLLRECVVVQNSNFFPSLYPDADHTSESHADAVAPVKSSAHAAGIPAPAPQEPVRAPELPYIETAEGEKLNVVLAFEAVNLKSLSTSTYEATLVNDSNFYLSVAYLSRPADSPEWTLRRADTIEPGTQLLLEEFSREDVPNLERLCLQIIAYKTDRPFACKQPVNVEYKLDVTKFFKLHCFTPNPYFDRPVIALDIIKNDIPYRQPDLSAALSSFDKEAKAKASRDASRERKPVKKQPKSDHPLEVDLHIAELVDSTAGLSSADMLNLQIDTFRRVMDENLRNKGKRIVFIHGKGDGVLRKALLKELAYRYKNCRWQDASFREYGFGATQVEIH